MNLRPIVLIMPIAAVLCSCERPSSEPAPPAPETAAATDALPADPTPLPQPLEANALSKQLSALQNETQDLATVLSDSVPASHELSDYFKESLAVIQRSLGFIRQDIEEGNWINAGIGLKEAAFLASFLREELKVSAEREAAKYREIDVTTFGLVGDGQTDNFPKFQSMLAEIKGYDQHVRLLFPEGNYVIKIPGKEDGISISGQKNLTFEGVGKVRFVFDASQGAHHNVSVANSSNIEFRNISTDMDPLPFTMATIKAVPSGNEILVKIEEGYPEPDDSYETAQYLRGVVRNRQTGKLDSRCGDPRVREIKAMGNSEYLLTLDDNAMSNNQSMTTNFKVGDYFAIHPRQRPSRGSGFEINNSKHVLFSKVDVHAADANIYGISGSAGIKFLDCNVEPGEGRLPVNNSDGFHCGSNPKGIYLDRCKVVNTSDDCLAFFTRLHSVGRVVDDNKFLIVGFSSLTPQSYKVGDAIAFVDANSGKYAGVTSVKSVQEVADWSGKNKPLLIETVEPVANVISRESVGRDLEIRDREYVQSGGDNYRRAMAVNAPFEYQIVNLSAKNDGWIVRNSDFGFNRANGFRVKAPNGVLRNTRFHDQVIVMTSEFNWWGGIYPEKIEMTDVTIDKRINFQGILPGGKRMDNEQLSAFMRHIRLENVKTGSGAAITLPW